MVRVVREVLRRFLGGGPWDDPDLRNNLPLYLSGLRDEIDSTGGDSGAYLQDCLEVLDGIWDEVYVP